MNLIPNQNWLLKASLLSEMSYISTYMYIRRAQIYGLILRKLQEKVSEWFIVVSGVLNNISKVHQNLITENVKISRWLPPFFF